MGRAARRRGFEKERELSRKLWEMGFATIRAPASGARTKLTIQPDLVAAKNGRLFCFEVKTRKRGPFYVPEEQARKLEEWARRAGALPLVAVYTNRRWYFVPLEEADRVEGARRITSEHLKKALGVEDLAGLAARA